MGLRERDGHPLSPLRPLAPRVPTLRQWKVYVSAPLSTRTVCTSCLYRFHPWSIGAPEGFISEGVVFLPSPLSLGLPSPTRPTRVIQHPPLPRSTPTHHPPPPVHTHSHPLPRPTPTDHTPPSAHTSPVPTHPTPTPTSPRPRPFPHPLKPPSPSAPPPRSWGLEE